MSVLRFGGVRVNGDVATILLELLCVAALIAFCIVVWWPASLLVVAIASGFAAWNGSRGRK